MKRSTIGPLIAYLVGGAIGIGLILTGVFVNANDRAEREHKAANTAYSQGYCASLGGEYVTDTVCNVGGRVVTVTLPSQ